MKQTTGNVLTGLYSAAAAEGGEALTVITISDHLRTGAALTADERERGFARMVTIACAALTTD